MMEISPRIGGLTPRRQGISQIRCLGDMSDDITLPNKYGYRMNVTALKP
jgi:hypothetical protein